MKKIIIAITGASGSLYAKRLLEKLTAYREQWSAIGIVTSNNAREVWNIETGGPFTEQPDFNYFGINDFNAPFASGSGKFDTMIVIPCSMGTLGRIAHGISNDLVTRAADVILKERRKLICVLRETPYNLIHIKNMEQVTLAGGIICPASPSFYSLPQTVEAVADTVVDRVLDLAGFDITAFRWGTTS